MFFTNVFSYSSRRRLCEHAYQKTRAELWQRRDELQPILARHGIHLNLGVLQDRHLTLVKPAAAPLAKNALLPVGRILAQLSDSLEDLERFVRVARARRGDPAA